MTVFYDAVMSGAQPKHSTASGLLGPWVQAHDKHHKAIQVYREPDLTADVRNAREAAMTLANLHVALNVAPGERDALRRVLLASPLRQRLTQGHTQKPPP